MSVAVEKSAWRQALPEIPKWKIDYTQEKVKEVYAKIFRPLKNCILTEKVNHEILQLIKDNKILITKKGELALLQSLSAYSNCILNPKLIRILTYQIVANLDMINDGVPIPSFSGIPHGQWIPLKIVGFLPLSTESSSAVRQKCIKMVLLIIDGAYAGFTVIRIVPLNYLPIFARDLGFSQRRKYESPEDLLDLIFIAWAEPSPADNISVEKYWLTANIKKKNFRIIRLRKPTRREVEFSIDESEEGDEGSNVT